MILELYIFYCCLSLERGLGGGEREEKAPQGLLSCFLKDKVTRARREGWDGEERGHCRKGKQCQERGLSRVGSVPGLCSGLTEEAWEGMTGAAAGEVCRGHILRGLRCPTKEVTSSEDLVKPLRLTNRGLSSALERRSLWHL